MKQVNDPATQHIILKILGFLAGNSFDFNFLHISEFLALTGYEKYNPAETISTPCVCATIVLRIHCYFSVHSTF